MPVQKSPRHTFSIAQVQANGSPGEWQNFPFLPSDYVVQESNEPNIRLDGTAQVSIYADVFLTFDMRLSADMSRLSNLYDPNYQEVYFNRPVPTYLPEGGSNFWVANSVGWYYSRGIFRKPPRWGKAGNINFYQCTMEISLVEWDWIYI
jgi:hypothetical protein